jgi:hypothetical protein
VLTTIVEYVMWMKCNYHTHFFSHYILTL